MNPDPLTERRNLMTDHFQPGAHYAFPHSIPDANTDFIEQKMFDLAYAGLSPAQKLDVYWPAEGNAPFPVIIAIHGGAFMGGDKRDLQLTPMLAGLQRGYAVASINYRMSGEARFPALVQDLKAAIRWLRANAERLRLDPERIATWGGSAGGYLSLMAGVSAGVAELDDLSLGNPGQSSQVQAVVDWFGPTDFLKMDEQLAESGLAPQADFAHNGANSPESLLLGAKITEIPQRVQAANPETYIRAGAPSFFIQHGTRDEIVPHQQSVSMAARLRTVLGAEQVHLELLLNAGHADPAFETPQNVEKVLDFLDRTLRG
jgi:acetyl esterase/lipase